MTQTVLETNQRKGLASCSYRGSCPVYGERNCLDGKELPLEFVEGINSNAPYECGSIIRPEIKLRA